MPFSTEAIANYLLDCASNSGVSITPMKLQKLMYFAQGWHLALEVTGAPLIKDSVQAWEYGPVFPATYHEFKEFGNGGIDRKATSIRLDGKKFHFYNPSVDDEAARGNLDLPFAKAVLDRIWAVYGRHSAVALSDMTHEKGSPWWTVREQAKKEFRGQIPKALNIPNEMIRDWFKERFQKPAASQN